MEIVRLSDTRPYAAPAHHAMTAFTLQGRDASSNEHFWVGHSIFLPGGGADRAASATEKVYVVLEGTITVMTDSETADLAPLDTCRIAPGEARVIENRGHDAARMLVISATSEPGEPA